MVPRRLLDGTTSHDGRELELFQQGDDFFIEIDRWDLMSSRAHHSEEQMAGLALAAWRGEHRQPRWLVGGLGMGFTLRACLEALDRCDGGSVVVAEAFAAVVTWNRGPLAHLADHPLDDRRVRVEVGDVFDQVAPQATPFDIILLDVDNGPDALTFMSNQRLYRGQGLHRLRQSLNPGGVLAIWSAADDADFHARLRKTGFAVDRQRVRARPGKGSQHTIFLATRPKGRRGGKVMRRKKEKG